MVVGNLYGINPAPPGLFPYHHCLGGPPIIRPLSREPKVVEDGRGGVSKVFGDYSKARLFFPKQVTCQVQYQVKCQNI